MGVGGDGISGEGTGGERTGGEGTGGEGSNGASGSGSWSSVQGAVVYSRKSSKLIVLNVSDRYTGWIDESADD